MIYTQNRVGPYREIKLSVDDLEENVEISRRIELRAEKRRRIEAYAQEDPDFKALLALVDKIGNQKASWELGLNIRTIRDLCQGVNHPSNRTRQALREYLKRQTIKK